MSRENDIKTKVTEYKKLLYNGDAEEAESLYNTLLKELTDISDNLYSDNDTLNTYDVYNEADMNTKKLIDSYQEETLHQKSFLMSN